MASYTLETGGELRPALQQEWLLTNGLGGYAQGTVAGCNTRRYHGLLCVPQRPPLGRVMLLNRVGEVLRFGLGEREPVELSINQFGDTFHPRGDQWLRRFELGRTARWVYQAEEVRVVKELLLQWKGNLAGIRYAVKRPRGMALTFELLPFVSLRDFHSLLHQGEGLEVRGEGHALHIQRGDMSLNLLCKEAAVQVQPDWWHQHTYCIETDRGMEDTEDLLCPGRFTFELPSDAEETAFTLWASSDPIPSPPEWEVILEQRPAFENSRPSKPAAKLRKPASQVISGLTRAANDFVVERHRPDGGPAATVIAGYPWFGDWGRDTMISLPGLLLTTGRFDEAKKTLLLFADYISEGMIPNRFDDYTNQPQYNTVDASLWFIHAAFEYRRCSNDKTTFEKQLRPACLKIIDGYRSGTRFDIRMDPADGLITQGNAQTQLTWMDAKCGDVAFTPRQGKAVEINALWYHALVLLGDTDSASRVAQSFREKFWISPFRGLADVVNDQLPDGQDRSLRPNQIFAVSLPNSPLKEDQQQAVVEGVRRELLTPYGLRTLSQGDPRYHGRYAGPQPRRDEAYHNGTVWPWLIGPFLEAYLRVNQNTPAAMEQARRWLSPLVDQMRLASIGQLHEIYEGDAPHRPVGCPAQAWSIAEVLRLAVMLDM